MHDLVIQGGTVVDGTGAASRTADVAITDGIITEVGKVRGAAKDTIAADGALITPGFVDPHTHFDGQITWDPYLTPSCWHGVTSVVFGNCGVGFAPVKPDKHEWLIGLMEGVEDIPGAALADGIKWGWESFPEYLDAVALAPKMMDVGALVPHGSVRGYVMGDRGAKNQPANAADIEAMAAIVREGMQAGALGFSTSRTIAHMAIDGEPVPGTFAAEDELFGIGRVLGELGTGVFELAPAGALGEDLAAPEREMAWVCKLAKDIGRPVSIVLTQNDHAPSSWKDTLSLAAAAAASGAQVRPQVHGRSVTLLIGLQNFHPFAYCPSWGALGLMELEERVAAMRNTDVKACLLEEIDSISPAMLQFIDPERVFALGENPDYEPKQADSIAARARVMNRQPYDLYYDTLMEDGGKQLLLRPLLNYTDFNLDVVRAMLEHPTSAWGLSDGGAHCGTTCDASTPTFMLTHWTRDRDHDRLPLEWIVKKMTSDSASLFGLGDRGTLEPGKIGDVNVIDYDALRLYRPEMIHDLPGGARRFIQRSSGYIATVKTGKVVMQQNEPTGVLPGVLIRGAR